MADGFIVRRGGGAAAERTEVPSINFVSKAADEIVVTFTNNENTEIDLYYGIDETPPLTKITLDANDTTSNITFSGLDDDTEYTISAYAIVTNQLLKKIKSEIVSTSITTDAAIYTAATGGTTEEYDDGGKRYRSHTFTTNGTFEVTTAGNGDRNQVDYLIIAGGGAGGSGDRGAGGGAGGYRTTVTPTPGNTAVNPKANVTETTYSVTIGGGGTGLVQAAGFPVRGGPGSNSSVTFPSTITSTGGGGGGLSATNGSGGSGGSGGGGGGDANTGYSGGVGISGQGRNGGRGRAGNISQRCGGGGGGAGAVGQNSPSAGVGGNGGTGLASTLRDGTSETRAGGGAGHGRSAIGTGGDGGGATNGPGTANTGGGGSGGSASGANENGGSGIVIIRYEIAPSV